MARRTTIAALAAASLALTACSAPAASPGGSGGAGEAPQSVRIANFLDIPSWDPAEADIGFDVLYLSAVYDPLVQLAPDGTVEPGLATEWTYSDDRTTLTLELRTDATFSDGEAFDAEAAVANIEHLADGIRSGEAFTHVTDVRAVDDDTVEIQLDAPDPTMLWLMAVGRSFMASPAVLDDESLATTPVGSGPYTLAASTPGSEYTFERVETHWADAEYPFDTVTVQPILDATARNNAMLSGQVDVNYALQNDLPQAEERGFNVSQAVGSWVGLKINDHAGEQLEPLGDVRVRRAIAMAFDGAAILESVGQGVGVATDQVFAAESPGFDPSLDGAHPFDVEAARALMAEAGYADGFSVEMPMAPAFQPWQAIATQNLAAIGIEVTWQDLSMPDYQANAPTYPMFVGVFALQSDPATTVARYVTTPQWYQPEPDFEVDEELPGLVEQLQTADEEQQVEIAQQINARLVDQVWQDVWYQSNNIYVSIPEIEVTPVVGQMFPVLRYVQPAG